MELRTLGMEPGSKGPRQCYPAPGIHRFDWYFAVVVFLSSSFVPSGVVKRFFYAARPLVSQDRDHSKNPSCQALSYALVAEPK